MAKSPVEKTLNLGEKEATFFPLKKVPEKLPGRDCGGEDQAAGGRASGGVSADGQPQNVGPRAPRAPAPGRSPGKCFPNQSSALCGGDPQRTENVRWRREADQTRGSLWPAAQPRRSKPARQAGWTLSLAGAEPGRTALGVSGPGGRTTRVAAPRTPSPTLRRHFLHTHTLLLRFRVVTQQPSLPRDL